MSKKKKVQKSKPAGAVFVYTSECCKAPARKPAVQRSPEDRKENKFSECTLGHWRCSQCGKPAKVTRSKPNKETATDGGPNGTAEANKSE